MVEMDLSNSKRAINRALMHVTLEWGVNPETAHHNPVFWHNGSLNYHDSASHRKEVFGYLKTRGILGDGFNGAFKLNYGLNELDQAADVDFARGIDLDVVIGLLVSQLYYQHCELAEFGQLIEVTSRVVEIIGHLSQLEYVERTVSDGGHAFRWTGRAEPMLKAQYMHA